MRANGHALRLLWAVFGGMSAVVLAFGSASDVLIFMLSSGSYAGQAHYRHLAWQLLIWLAVGWVVTGVTMIWPALRWKRRGLYEAPGESAGPDLMGDPAR